MQDPIGWGLVTFIHNITEGLCDDIVSKVSDSNAVKKETDSNLGLEQQWVSKFIHSIFIALFDDNVSNGKKTDRINP